MRINRGSPHAHVKGVGLFSQTIGEILRAYLLASATMPGDVAGEGFDQAIKSFVGGDPAEWHLPPALMLDFADNNFAEAIAYLESARTKIANAAIEELAPGERDDFDARMEDLLEGEDDT